MSAAKNTIALVERLERLGGGEFPSCVPEYRSLADRVRDSPRFLSSLKRIKALADENRLLAVALLKRRRELCACEVQAATGLTHATVSHHMSVLADAGLISARREGKWMYYRLQDGLEVALP
jgi:DNA-binding transcriptional ArsR family regulator